VTGKLHFLNLLQSRVSGSLRKTAAMSSHCNLGCSDEREALCYVSFDKVSLSRHNVRLLLMSIISDIRPFYHDHVYLNHHS